ncbi:MAG: protein kinase [Archangium sp.]|nr:protein kinase [Archangium sp.]
MADDPTSPGSGQHLGPEETAQYAAGLLDASSRARIDHHIDACPDCRELLSTLVRTALSVTTARVASVTTENETEGVLPKGTRVGPFEVQTPIGAGGMGVVYVAFDPRLQRQVALKSVRDRRGDPQQLLNEAKLMAQLAHPNVVPVYEVVEAYGQLYIAMELVPGRTLRQWLEAEPRTWQQIVDAWLEAGAGLAAAHAAGIIHGDMKPGNVLIGNDGRVRVTDFGLATSGVEAIGSLRGTVAYMAPEQRKGAPSDQKSDQYAFAVSVHEALWGLPGSGSRKSNAPRGLRRVLERALSEKPEARWPSMKDLLAALRSERLQRWRFVVAALAAAALFAVFSFSAGGRRATTAQCEAAANELTSPWTQEARTATRDAFKRTQASYADETLARVEQSLDAWHTAFEKTRSTTCSAPLFSREATPRLAAQLECLEDAALDARALVTQLLDADVALVLRAVAASQQLPAPEKCLDVEKEEQLVPSRNAAARGVNEQIARARAMAAAGKYKDALGPAQDAVKAADASGDVSLRAQARAVAGGIQGMTFDADGAVVTLLEAIRLAEQAHDDRARCTAWTGLLEQEYNKGHHDLVVQFSGPALGACERLNDVRLVTETMGTLGSSLAEQGKLKESRALLEEAVQKRVNTFGENDRRTSTLLSTLANTLAMSGDLNGAIAAHEKSLRAAEVAFGKAHPETAIIRQNLGDDFVYGLQGPRGVAELKEAVEVMKAANTEKARMVVLAMADLGLAYLVAGQPKEALEVYDRAIAVFATDYPKHPTYAAALLGRVQAQQALGEKFDLTDLKKASELSGELPPFERGRVLLELGIATKDVKVVTEAEGLLESFDLPLIVRERERAVRTLKEWGAPSP